MIFADPSESRGLAGVLEEMRMSFNPGLEALTGADIVVTPLQVPVVAGTLPDHLKAGAVLIQRKTGVDLVTSIGERMAVSLGRMRATGARQSQCVLLFIGSLLCDAEGNAVVNGSKVEYGGSHSYWSVIGAVSKWNERGGVYESISRPALLPRYLKMKETHISEFVYSPVKQVYDMPDPYYAANPGDPLQELQLVRDWRNTLLTIPGIGPKRMEALLEVITAEAQRNPQSQMTLTTALLWLTHWPLIKTVPGFGKGIYATIRAWFGLEQGMDLSVTYDFAEQVAKDLARS